MRYWQTEIKHHNQSYVLRLWTPTATTPKEGYPLLLMLDGDWIHAFIVQFLQNQSLSQFQPIHYAIATIGFGNVERQIARQRRSYDYTPIPKNAANAVDPREPTWPCGGADAFLQLIREKALPLLGQQYPINWQRLGLYGHSYGGLFTLYTLLSEPAVFQHYIAASPSLWWYAPFMQELAAHLPTLTTSIRLDLLLGAKEQWRPKPSDPSTPRPTGIPTQLFLDEFISNLPTSTSLVKQCHIFPEAEHGAMLALSTKFALRNFST